MSSHSKPPNGDSAAAPATASSGTATYVTHGGVQVTRITQEQTYQDAIEPIRLALDARRGVLLTSSFEYPGRYTRWDMGFVDPPLMLEGRGRRVLVQALNQRGEVILPAVHDALRDTPAVAELRAQAQRLDIEIKEPEGWFAEELRSRQHSVFSLLRAIIAHFGCADDHHLGLYGAFGYELAFQFERPRLRLPRAADERDLLLYLPDELLVVDHRRESAMRIRYDFRTTAGDTAPLPRGGASTTYRACPEAPPPCDHAPGEYAATVREAIECFRKGDLFEVVPGQTFFEPCPAPPSTVFARLRERNPSPYGALINLGDDEYLVAASPEMYVRSEGRRIETCPISGTIKRGETAIEDAANILELLSSEKETSELTMCTDVDRNDKSRVCVPGSVRVIGRRQIEMYSRLIHTVDHVEGLLREDFDALDAFLAHAWAVTVTGAPKQHAIQFLEDHERSVRRWYGGALGMLGFDGNVNTGLTLRTVRIKQGIAEVRAGATLLFESDPDAEEAETRLKASALLDAIKRPDDNRASASAGTAAADVEVRADGPGAGKRIVMIDHEDSFVHTLSGYFRQTGAEVVTFRAGFPAERLAELNPHLLLLSPGPGRPADFDLQSTLRTALDLQLPVFGVCLGLQGMVEHFGGELGLLPEPMHGKESRIEVLGGRLFEGLPRTFKGGRYHSLYALEEKLPACLQVTARSSDGVIMAVEHQSLPLAAVQFHPESILSLHDRFGIRLVNNVVELLAR
ncbi:MAG: anthranilate synthase component I [Gammaproteobacteria bacterium]|nr:anthranilate synthase component I [Gammaproteobacteria bacterium]